MPQSHWLSSSWTIFENAALPQKCLFLVFIALMIFGAWTAVFSRVKPFAGLSAPMKALSLLCPLSGLLCAALNGFHMMQTTLRLPSDPTVQMLVPGLMEMFALVVAGGLAGLAAATAHSLLRARERAGLQV
jgi:hypothetical protein